MLKLRLQLLLCKSKEACKVRSQVCHKQLTRVRLHKQMPHKRKVSLIGLLKMMVALASPAHLTVIALDQKGISNTNK